MSTNYAGSVPVSLHGCLFDLGVYLIPDGDRMKACNGQIAESLVTELTGIWNELVSHGDIPWKLHQTHVVDKGGTQWGFAFFYNESKKGIQVAVIMVDVNPQSKRITKQTL